ncbi:MAG: hypothetical protein RJB62_14 [Pseudomonadota bacterium]|jgi:hypothetical protein
MKSTRNLIIPAIAALAIVAGSETVIAQELTADQQVIDNALYDFYYYDLDVTFLPLASGFAASAADAPNLLEQVVIGGRNYVAAAKCDTDCDDIDIAVVDGNGITLSTDTTDADFAYAEFTPDIDQTLWIRVVPDICNSAEPCDMGVAVYESDPALYPAPAQ